ncbi:MAG: hypothetical protein IPG34_12725 [Rhodocyclaceae bacterium]|nr:hypothetical protein [Rhodocyclaceae bacterium]
MYSSDFASNANAALANKDRSIPAARLGPQLEQHETLDIGHGLVNLLAGDGTALFFPQRFSACALRRIAWRSCRLRIRARGRGARTADDNQRAQ